MIFKAILFCTYLSLKPALQISAFISPAFRELLQERDLTFVMRSKTSGVAGLFTLKQGKLYYSTKIDGYVNFSAIWNGWRDADTLKKKMRLNMMDFMNKGMLTLEGDLSSMNYLLVLFGEMLGRFRKKQRAQIKRVELGKGQP